MSGYIKEDNMQGMCALQSFQRTTVVKPKEGLIFMGSCSPICKKMFRSARINSPHSERQSSVTAAGLSAWFKRTGWAFSHWCTIASAKSMRKTFFPFMTKWRRWSDVLCSTPAAWTLHKANIAKRLP